MIFSDLRHGNPQEDFNMGKLNFFLIPLGQDHPIEEKLRWARLLYEEIGKELGNDLIFKGLLEDYKKRIDNTWIAMKESGVVKECTLCATVDGGSCCGAGIENKFDCIELLINLFLNIDFPDSPFDPTGCFFLGERGCLLKARHVICVNFMCKRLYSQITEEKIKMVQRAMEKETEAAFILEEYIKHWLARHLSKE